MQKVIGQTQKKNVERETDQNWIFVSVAVQKWGGRSEMKKYRLLNKLYATLLGYFWLKCPLCSQYFGGHEKSGSLLISQSLGEEVCEDCIPESKHLNKKFWRVETDG